jgi:hypothetical protein
MTAHQQDDYKSMAKDAARDLARLSPYMLGKALRRWYLRKLIDHHLNAARSEILSAHNHNAAARHFVTLATAARGALEEMEGE